MRSITVPKLLSLMLGLLLAPFAAFAISPVQSTTVTPTAGVFTATLTGVASGALITVEGCAFRLGNATTTASAAPTDSAGVSPLTVGRAPLAKTDGNGNSFVLGIWHKESAGAGSHTITLDMGTGSATLNIGHMTVTEWPPGYVLDVSSENSGTTAQTVTSGSVSNTTTDGVSIVAMTFASSIGETSSAISHPPTGYTGLSVEQDGFNDLPHEYAYKSLSATGSQSATWTWTDTNTYGSLSAQAIYKASGGGGSTAVPVFMNHYRNQTVH